MRSGRRTAFGEAAFLGRRPHAFADRSLGDGADQGTRVRRSTATGNAAAAECGRSAVGTYCGGLVCGLLITYEVMYSPLEP